MCSHSVWLPELMPLDAFGGNWERYVEAVYLIFKQDFVDSKPMFQGCRFGLKKHPVIQGKEYTFWHFVSEGSEEENRLPDLRRCERIKWPRPIIENESDSCVKVWRNKRGRNRYILLWYESLEYLVVLADRGSYMLPWTAYLVTRNHNKNKLRREYEAYRKANAAP